MTLVSFLRHKFARQPSFGLWLENYKVHFLGVPQGYNFQAKFCKIVLLFQKQKWTQGNIAWRYD